MASTGSDWPVACRTASLPRRMKTCAGQPGSRSRHTDVVLQLIADRELAGRDLVLLAERLQRLDRLVVRVDVRAEGDIGLAVSAGVPDAQRTFVYSWPGYTTVSSGNARKVVLSLGGSQRSLLTLSKARAVMLDCGARCRRDESVRTLCASLPACLRTVRSQYCSCACTLEEPAAASMEECIAALRQRDRPRFSAPAECRPLPILLHEETDRVLGMARRRVASHFDAADVEGLAVLDLVGQALALLRAAVDLDAREVLGELVVAARVVVIWRASASTARS